MIKIIIADDHSVVRKGLKQVFDETLDIRVTDEAANGFELLEKLRTNKYDLVLLDLSMPGIDGLDTLKEIKKEHPDLPVLIFTMYPEEQYAVRLIKSGASGYLNKESNPEDLIKAILIVHSGRKYISPEIGELLAENTDFVSDFKPHKLLSDREYQVFCLMVMGMSVTQIADKLSLSISTIGTYRMRILEKMNMSTIAELTYYAVKNGLIQ